jgi:hypothetical protein
MKGALIFVVLAAALDCAIGAGLERVQRRTLAGEASGGLINQALSRDVDVLVLGSSRARHHLSPEVLQQELSLSVFNAGANGHDLLYAVMLFDLWRRSHSAPTAVLLHVDPKSFVRFEPELERASAFAPYLEDSEIVREVLSLRGPFQSLKQLSAAYRFNGKVLPIFRNAFVRADESAGFHGLPGSLDPAQVPDPPERNSRQMETEPFWSPKILHLEKLVLHCASSGTRVFLVHSARYRRDARSHAAWVRRVRDLAANYPNVEFVEVSEVSHPELFAGRPELFRDESHMNRQGAEIFSRVLARTLRSRMFDSRFEGPTAASQRASPQ